MKISKKLLGLPKIPAHKFGVAILIGHTCRFIRTDCSNIFEAAVYARAEKLKDKHPKAIAVVLNHQNLPVVTIKKTVLANF